MSTPKGIKETREVVHAVGSIAVALIDDLKDGKFSLSEGIAFLTKFGLIRAAVQGINEVPAELADLDASERELLMQDIADALTSAGLSHRIADASGLILHWAYNTVSTFVKIRNAPPSAVAVQ